GERRQAAIVAACPAELDRYVLTLGEATFLQAAPECFEPVHGILRRARAHKPDHRHRRRLRARRERPCSRAAEQPDELPAPHSITSSRVASSLSGTVSPSILAVEALMTSSNLLDCTTGKSAGFAPLRIRPA